MSEQPTNEQPTNDDGQKADAPTTPTPTTPPAKPPRKKPVPPPQPRSFADPKTKRAFLEALKKIGNVSAAAGVAGVHRHTVGNESERNPDFAIQVEIAKGSFKNEMLTRIFNATKKDWRAAAWLLERIYHNEFGARDPDAVTPEQVMAAVNRMVSVVWPLIPPERHGDFRAAMESLAGTPTAPPQAEAGGRNAKAVQSAVVAG